MTSDGKIEAGLNNPVVPTSILQDVWRWKQGGATFEDVLHRLRLKCVPPNIVPKPWMPSQFPASSWYTFLLLILLMIDIEKEDENMLKSVLAQFEYTYQVCDWDKKRSAAILFMFQRYTSLQELNSTSKKTMPMF